jgi:hypothetical protein
MAPGAPAEELHFIGPRGNGCLDRGMGYSRQKRLSLAVSCGPTSIRMIKAPWSYTTKPDRQFSPVRVFSQADDQ